MSKIKKNRTFFGIVAKVVDILVYPVIIISFMSSFFMIVAKSKNAINPIFGHTFARVLSNSMSYYCKEAGRIFLKGDITILKTGKARYEVGDIIGFYYYNDVADNSHLFDLTKYESKEVEKLDNKGNVITDSNGQPMHVLNKYVPVVDDVGMVVFDQEMYDRIINCEIGESFIDHTTGNYYTKIEPQSNRKTVADVQESNTPIYFHQIVQIKIDAAGTLYYITKGTANAEKDTYEIRHDFVVGEYVSTPMWLSGFVNFCASTEGMILLVVAPIAIVVLVELLSILEQINNILLERKVINREIAFDSKECIKANIGIEMRNADKVFYYDVMPPEYKEEVYEYLWGYLRNNDSKHHKKLFNTSQMALSVYNMENPSLYYATWKELYKNKIFKNQINRAEDRAEQEKYADVVFVEYQNYLEDVLLASTNVKSSKTEDSITEDEKKNTPFNIEEKLKEVEEKLEKTKRLKGDLYNKAKDKDIRDEEDDICSEVDISSNEEPNAELQATEVKVKKTRTYNRSNGGKAKKDSKTIKNNVNVESDEVLQDDKVQDGSGVVEDKNILDNNFDKQIDVEQKMKEVEEKLAMVETLQNEKSKSEFKEEIKKPRLKRRRKKSKNEINNKLEEVEGRLKKANESLKQKNSKK